MVILLVAISVSFGGLDQFDGVLDKKEIITIWVKSLVFWGDEDKGWISFYDVGGKCGGVAIWIFMQIRGADFIS